MSSNETNKQYRPTNFADVFGDALRYLFILILILIIFAPKLAEQVVLAIVGK